MKRILCIFILACCAFVCFAQNVKPYVVDLSKIPATSDDKSMTFDKTTRTFTVQKQDASKYAGIYFSLNNLVINISIPLPPRCFRISLYASNIPL